MTHSTTLSVFTDDVFTDAELRTLAGFLGGYSGLTRDAYALDLRQFAQWCHDRRLGLFAVARGDIEAFARNLEDFGRARATISRRLCTITSLIATRSRKVCSIARRPCTSAVHDSTTSPTRPASIATRSARCSLLPGWPELEITH